MKRLTATEARKNFFHLLDEAARGDPVFIERKGILIRMTREKKRLRKNLPEIDYSPYFKGSLDDADRWSWDWRPGKGLKPKILPKTKRS